MSLPLAATSYTTVNSLGSGLEATWAKLAAGESGLRPCTFLGEASLPMYVGMVEGLDDFALEGPWADYDCRNNRLAWMALQSDGFSDSVREAAGRYGRDRIAVILGTSTSGILHLEQSYLRRELESGALPKDFHMRETFNIFSAADFVRRCLGLTGYASVISTSCSSSAKAFASAWRLIQSGVCDAALVGGVDSLCLTTLCGFHSLQLVSPGPCRPFDLDRDGLSIGEAAGFALLEKADRAEGGEGEALLGFGESSDGHHMTSPHPDGLGSASAMSRALEMAGLPSSEVDYVNLHGTATRANDRSEGLAVAKVMGKSVPCSSTKGWTGHALGAAGILEAVISLLCIRKNWMPRSLNTRTPDPECGIHVVLESRHRPIRRVMSNSFGFGGTNCSLLLGSS